MKNRLISMTDKVEELTLTFKSKGEVLQKIVNNAKFRKLPIEKWMLVPCDEEGNVMKKPSEVGFLGSQEMQWDFYKQKYQQAKEKVLFEGFECNNYDSILKIENKNILIAQKVGKFNWMFTFKTIEDLVKHNLTLTPSAIKKFNL